MMNRIKSFGWVLVIAIVVIVIRAVVLIALDIRAGSSAMDSVVGTADFRAIKPGMIRHLDILDSLCVYPYDKECYGSVNERGDTILFSRSKGNNRVWWSLNNVRVSSIRSVNAHPRDPRSSYSSNAVSGIGQLPWSITRNTGSGSLQLMGIKIDSLIGHELISGAVWSQNFRSRKLELIDTANVLIASISAKHTLEGTIMIEQRNLTTTLLIQWE
jgi:hypothetical protein